MDWCSSHSSGYINMNNNNAFDQFFCYSVYFLPWALILQGIKNETSTDFFNFGCFWVVSFIIFLPPPPPHPPGLCLMMRGWEAYLVPWHHLVGPWLSSLHLVIWGGTLSYLVLVIDRSTYFQFFKESVHCSP